VQLGIIEDMAFNLLESGHTREAVLGYEVQYILGYLSKRVEVGKERQEAGAQKPQTSSRPGTKTVKTVMTAQDALAKVRSQNRR